MSAPLHAIPDSAESTPLHDPQQFLDEVAQALSHDLRILLRPLRSAQCYALVNAGQCAPGSVAKLVADHELDAEPLFAHTAEEAHVDQGPWLLRLPSQPSDALLLRLAADAGSKQALSMIASPLRNHVLCAHLRSWFNGLLEDKSQVLMRYFDPRIGLDMVQCWPQPVRQQFLGALQWWASWDHLFTPRAIRGAAQPQPAALEEPLEIGAELQLALDRLNHAERLQALILKEDTDPGELDHIAPPLLRVIAHLQLQRAEQLDLNEWGDQRLLIALGLRMHPQACDEPRLNALLHTSAAAKESIAAVIGRMPAAYWEEQQADAPRSLALLSEKILTPLRMRRAGNASSHPLASLA
ncbi:hypothetical protein CFter6_1365 [Collimonas fungivorans]|uniref:DUF4123 domain-containing protein n=1 Tax=Collimonas fungivorans TaxID=158899 RepID=A0A127P8E3_9BURK|nr:DUF4123 domain-containing protein [Collimonas fungivorans]AMO94076.1 hypothetical protein CFter6_1365 [Collimonas fungivorans]